MGVKQNLLTSTESRPRVLSRSLILHPRPPHRPSGRTFDRTLVPLPQPFPRFSSCSRVTVLATTSVSRDGGVSRSGWEGREVVVRDGGGVGGRKGTRRRKENESCVVLEVRRFVVVSMFNHTERGVGCPYFIFMTKRVTVLIF